METIFHIRNNGRKVLLPVQLEIDSEYIYVNSGYNKTLIEEIKSMKGAKWMGYDKYNPRKVWRIDNCEHNLFQIEYLENKNPYAPYDTELDIESVKKLIKPRYLDGKSILPMDHQYEMIAHGLQRKQCILAAEMGTGKTLVAIYIMELSGLSSSECWYIAPKSALTSVRLELARWSSRIRPELYTYEQAKKTIENWPAGKKPPKLLIADESSRLKNEMAQRTQVIYHLSKNMRSEYGRNCYIIEMTGSPAPKSPLDWWSQCHIACPGFLKEGDRYKLHNRLALIEKAEGIGGGYYPKLITWYDNEKKCKQCGEFEDKHDMFTGHDYLPSINEVHKLYSRMKGLVLVKFKKDCTDLPDKNYKIIQCEVDPATLRAARLLKLTSKRAIEHLTKLREISDGFQYVERVLETKKCSLCDGTKIKNEDACPACDGTGTVKKFERECKEVPTPKDEVLIDLLEDHEDVGRVVIYAGFTASINRVLNLCKKQGWQVIKFDGEGFYTDLPMDTFENAIKCFQNGQQYHPKVAFIGHPGSAGMGLTLTASPSIIYYSNDFNAESRIQSEDRIHRIGMDINRGATIYDIFNLPSDKIVHDNLKAKRDLQLMTMGELTAAMEENIER